MEITLTNVDKVNATLSVKMVAEDYQEKVEKTLKNFKKKANMPGFRPGMVPMSLVKKMYGTEAKAEEVNKLLSDKIYEYIRENKVNMLGEPLPGDSQTPIDMATQDSFEFIFDIALAPEFKAELTGRDKVPYYDIEVSDSQVDEQIKMYSQRFGKYEKVEEYQSKDMLKGLLGELDETGNVKENGLKVEGAVIMPEYFKNDAQKVLFENAKSNSVIVFNPFEAYEGNEVELASLLKIKKEEVASYKGSFSYQIQEITRFVPAEINQTLFDQIFGKDVIKSEEEFKAKVKENLTTQYIADSDYKFLLDVRAHMVKKIGKLEFPDEKLKKIMRLNNKDKDEKFVEDNYAKSIDELTWHLIKEQLVAAQKIQVKDEDLKNVAREAARYQFAQYGLSNVPDDALDNYATEMLKKREQVDGLVNRCIDQKLTEALKNVVKLDRKAISVEDFNKMFQ